MGGTTRGRCAVKAQQNHAFGSLTESRQFDILRIQGLGPQVSAMQYASVIGLFCAGLLLNSVADAQSPGAGVRIGILNDQSGPYADFGGKTSVEAARMAIGDFGGQVLGKPVEIISGDHQNKADIGSAIARRWFDVDGISAIAELTNSAVALAVQQIAKEQGKITLSTGPATTRLTNEDCSQTGFHWAFDTYSQAVGTARAIVAEGGKTWFLLVADYAFGHQLASDLTKVVKASGGTVLGEVRHPLNTSDFSSFLLRAQSSKAQIIGLASAGADTINSVKQAAEYRIAAGGQKLAGLVVVISDVHALGLATANGLVFTTAFYWDRDEASRVWSKRFSEKTGRMPGMVQAGTYSAVLHYLKAVQAAGTADGKAVATKIRELPVEDFFAKGWVREDGRMMHDMYLVEVKAPPESQGAWDYYKILRRIPAEEAAQPMSESKCPLAKK
jgi:branched-chain amino acid transport system substrate-binding protein